MSFVDFLIAAGVPSIILSFVVWYMQHKITKRENERERAQAKKEAEKEKSDALKEQERKKQEEKREEREKNTEKLMLMIMQTSRANNVLAVATAKAVQRIPDSHCNGDMTAALAEAARIQKEEKDFLMDQGIRHIFED